MTDTEMHILKTATCKSVSGKSTLTYQLGQAPDHTVHISICKNSAAGQFSSEWIKIDDVLKALTKASPGNPLTSYLLEPLFTGRSVNTPAFIMAALTQEKLLRVLRGRKRGHEWYDRDGFELTLEKLTSGKTKRTTRKKAVRKTTSKKAQIKKKAAARKKAVKTG